jgi:hypothetical protein
MGMFTYGNFKSAGKPDTPQFAAAAARQGQLDSEAQMQANALRSQNMLGAGELYNVGMGDKSPIADKLGSMFGGPEAEVAGNFAADGGVGGMVDLGGGGSSLGALEATSAAEAAVAEGAMATAAETAVGELAATEALTAGVGGAVAPAGAAAAEAAGAGAAAAGGLSSTALAALGPLGIALLLGSLA